MPESAAQAKAAAKAAAEEASLAPGPSHTPQPPGGRLNEAKMPPIGNFMPPTSNSKDKKRKPTTAAPSASQTIGETSRGAGTAQSNKVWKRKQSFMKQRSKNDNFDLFLTEIENS